MAKITKKSVQKVLKDSGAALVDTGEGDWREEGRKERAARRVQESSTAGPDRADGGSMQLIVNGKPMSVTAGLTVQAVLAELNIHQVHGVAVAVNSVVVARSQSGETVLREGDRLEIIQATTGG